MRRHRPIVYCLLLAGAAANAAPDSRYYFGPDLCYVNEIEDCGAAYSFQGEKRDPFESLYEPGANSARVRLWNDARRTPHSDPADASRTLTEWLPYTGKAGDPELEPFLATQFDTFQTPFFFWPALENSGVYFIPTIHH